MIRVRRDTSRKKQQETEHCHLIDLWAHHQMTPICQFAAGTFCLQSSMFSHLHGSTQWTVHPLWCHSLFTSTYSIIKATSENAHFYQEIIVTCAGYAMKGSTILMP